MRQTTITYGIDDDGHARNMRIKIEATDAQGTGSVDVILSDVLYTSEKHFENDVREHFRI